MTANIAAKPTPKAGEAAAHCREQLHEAARREHNAGAKYLRPLVLIQAQARRAGVETLDVAAVKKELMDNHRIPEEEIVIATGEERGLEQFGKHRRNLSSRRAWPAGRRR